MYIYIRIICIGKTGRWPCPTPLSLQSHLHPLTPPLYVAYIYIYTTPKQITATLLFSNDNTLCEGVWPPPSIKSNFTPKDTELSFVTAQTKESANGNA